MTQKTPLYQQHIEAGAKMVPFCGWEMPLNYGSQIEEHNAVRQDAGMFDVSHMTVVDLLGPGGRAFLRYLLANDVDRLKHHGQALYSCMLNEKAGVMDDLIVYYRGADSFRIVFNAATHDKVIPWVQQQSEGFSVGIQERTDLAMIAIQGPNAIEKTLKVLTPEQLDAAATLQPFGAADCGAWFIARTGYTGEDGFEITIPAEKAESFWQDLMAQNIKPCGLGARDTLRLEAGLSLYGNEMDDDVSPLNANLTWTVAFEPDDREFVGKLALEQQRERGMTEKLIGLMLEDKGVLRAGQKVIVPEVGEGIITSGTFSPTLQQSIALARVPKASKGQCFVEIRGKQLAAKIVKTRFIKNGEVIIEEIK